MRNIECNVYNTTHTENKNYITTIKVPKYKQIGRTVSFLRNYLREQSMNDFNHSRMRFYVFKSDDFLLRETDLFNYRK